MTFAERHGITVLTRKILPRVTGDDMDLDLDPNFLHEQVLSSPRDI